MLKDRLNEEEQQSNIGSVNDLDESSPALPKMVQPQGDGHSSKRTRIFLVLTLLVLLFSAGIVLFLFKTKETVQTNAGQNSSDKVDQSHVAQESKQTDDTIDIPDRGMYRLLPASDTVKFNAFKSTGSTYESSVVDDSFFLTLKIPKEWKVYSQPLDVGKQTLGRMIVDTNNGKYIHVQNVTGVGGGCDENNDKYNLVKKLSTNTPNLYLTQYSYANQNVEALRLERFPSEVSTSAHQKLQEGESAANTCNIPGYSFAEDPLYLTISDSKTSQLSSNLSWDEIKDDKQFVDAIRSLTVVHQ